jgi:TRAP transporter 4TM/12TM fusion protein
MGIHWALMGGVLVLANRSKFKGGIFVDILLFAATFSISVYQIFLRERLIYHPAIYTALDIALAVVAVVSVLYLGFKVLGKALSLICIFFLLYSYFGHYIPGIFNVSELSFKRIMTGVYTMTDGMFGSTLMVSARFLLLYIFFGAFMELSGAGQFFVDAVNSFAGRIRGGPAQGAILSSLMMGMVSGSGAANVVTIGTFTIPLMKKMGFTPALAGGVEAVASSGGQIMPPVMGAAAFLMAETLGIPYSAVAIAAVFPALLYFFALAVTVYGNSRILGLERVPASEMPSFRAVFKKGWFHMAPLLLIIFLVFGGYSPQKAAFWALVVAFAVTILFNRKAMSLKRLLDATINSAVGCAPIALTCILAGIIMNTINMSGFGLKVTTIIQMISGGMLIVTLFLAMVVSLLLGCGMPTTACYIVLAVVIAPSLVKMGVLPLAAHLFILYFGALSSLTPPVALSALTASSISGAGLWETGYEAIKHACTGFIVPFFFVYNNGLLLMGDTYSIVLAVVKAVVACAFIGLSVSGWMGIKLPIVSRVLLFACAIMLYVAYPFYVSWAGIGLFIAIAIVTWFFAKKRGAVDTGI